MIRGVVEPELDAVVHVEVQGPGGIERVAAVVDAEAEVEWHGERKDVQVDLADADPLIGMRLLRGSQLCLDVTEGGAVEISPLADDS